MVFEFASDGPGIAKGSSDVLKVDGQEVATLKVPKTIPFLMPADQTFDIGVGTRTSVNEKAYQMPFPFTDKINKLRSTLAHTPVGRRTKDYRESDRHSQRLNAQGEPQRIQTRALSSPSRQSLRKG